MNRNPRRKIYDRTQLTKQAQKNRQITGPLRQKKNRNLTTKRII